MAFAYIPMSPDDKKLLETIFTDEFMQAETNFELLEIFSLPAQCLQTGNPILWYIMRKCLTDLSEKVPASHHGMKWYVPQPTEHFLIKKNRKTRAASA